MNADDIEEVREAAIEVLKACDRMLGLFELMRCARPFEEEESDAMSSWRFAQGAFSKIFRENLADGAHWLELLNDRLDRGAQRFFEAARVAAKITNATAPGYSLSLHWAHWSFEQCAFVVHEGLCASAEVDDPMRCFKPPRRADKLRMLEIHSEPRFNADSTGESELYWLRVADRMDQQDDPDFYNQLFDDCWRNLELLGIIDPHGRRSADAEKWIEARTGVEHEATAALMLASTVGGLDKPTGAVASPAATVGNASLEATKELPVDEWFKLPDPLRKNSDSERAITKAFKRHCENTKGTHAERARAWRELHPNDPRTDKQLKKASERYPYMEPSKPV